MSANGRVTSARRKSSRPATDANIHQFDRFDVGPAAAPYTAVGRVGASADLVVWEFSRLRRQRSARPTWRRLVGSLACLAPAPASSERDRMNDGDPYGNRTRVTAVRGPRPDR